MTWPAGFEDAARRYGFTLDGETTVEHSEMGQEWRLRQGGRVLRWALVDGAAAPHVQRDASMLAVLQHFAVSAPLLMHLDVTQDTHVVSVQHLPQVDAHPILDDTEMTEVTWRSLGGYLRALHGSGLVPWHSRGHLIQPLDVASLRRLEDAGRLSVSERRWLTDWAQLLPQQLPLAPIHSYVRANWVITDRRRSLVLGLSEWSLARLDEPGVDLLYVPDNAIRSVLEGYGSAGAGLLLLAKLRRWLADAVDGLAPEATAEEAALSGRVAELFDEQLNLVGLTRSRLD